MAKKQKLPFLLRASYWFDNKMAEGLWPKVKLLLGVTVVFVLIIGTIATLALGTENAGESYLRTLMYTLGKGGALSGADTASPLFFVMMLVTILYCMFFSAILIGLINNALRSKVDELGKGQSRVLEEDHTLILGFDESTLVLVEEFIEANRNQKKPHAVVILGKEDRQIMADALRRRFGRPTDHPETVVICRTGTIYSFNDLERCALRTCHDVIVNGETDFETVKAIMACSQILGSNEAGHQPYIIAVMHDDNNAIEAMSAARSVGVTDQLEFLPLNETLARIMVHTSRQPGLSHVFTELFNYSGSEFYIVHEDSSFPQLYGRNIEEINRMLKTAFAVGVMKKDGEIIIGDPVSTIFSEGDSLITVMEDDDALVVAKEPYEAKECQHQDRAARGNVSALVLGTKPVLDAVLSEYGDYLPRGSTIHVADVNESGLSYARPSTIEGLESKDIDVVYHHADIRDRQVLNALLDESDAECVLVLSDADAKSPEESDEWVMRTLIFLREYRKSVGRRISITCEINNAANRDLAAATGPDDFILGNHISALIMAQISQERSTAKIFDTILTSEGYEVYMKDASWYVMPNEPIDLISASAAVAKRGEILIGIHQKRNGVFDVAEISPSKFTADMQTPRKYTFGVEDQFVVLAEDGRYV